MTRRSPIGGLEHPEANGPRLLLADHHREIGKACSRLRASLAAGDRDDIAATFRACQDAILEHHRAEEELILPAYAVHDPMDAARIRSQHADIANALFELGLAVDLQRIQPLEVDRFVTTLREHGAHEDNRMYPWAQVHLPLQTRDRLLVTLGRSLLALVRDRLRRLAGGRLAQF